jgi:lipopolysaccharide transport system permease protein
MDEWSLIKSLAWSDFKLKYGKSAMGFFWSLIKPLLILGTLYIVFSILISLSIPNYALFLLLGIVLWNFFAEATLYGMQGFIAKASMLSNMRFPRRVIVISSSIHCFLTLLLNLAVFFIFFAFFGASVSITIIALPLLLGELFLLSLGFSFGLSALYMKYRDLSHIWDVLLQIGFWATPIIYSISLIPANIVKWYMLNPMARIIDDSRNAVIFGSLPSLWHSLITIIICLIVFAIGYFIFIKREQKFAEEL